MPKQTEWEITNIQKSSATLTHPRYPGCVLMIELTPQRNAITRLRLTTNPSQGVCLISEILREVTPVPILRKIMDTDRKLAAFDPVILKPTPGGQKKRRTDLYFEQLARAAVLRPTNAELGAMFDRSPSQIRDDLQRAKRYGYITLGGKGRWDRQLGPRLA